MNDCSFNYFKNDIELRCNRRNTYHIPKLVHAKSIAMMTHVRLLVVSIDYVYILDPDGFSVTINQIANHVMQRKISFSFFEIMKVVFCLCRF